MFLLLVVVPVCVYQVSASQVWASWQHNCDRIRVVTPSHVMFNFQDFEIMGKAGKIVRLVRVMRVMRIFKLVRHFAGLQSLIYTLNQAYKELGLLMLLVGVAVLTFASLVYFAEKDNPAGSWSFLDSFWWGLMTLTTVG